MFWSKQVSTKLRELSLIRDESAVLLNALAEQVEDFSVTLIDQVNTKEELSIEHEKKNMDTYASLLDEITESAIRFSQKKVKHKTSYTYLLFYSQKICRRTTVFDKYMPPAQMGYVFFYFWIVYTCFISCGGRFHTCAQKENTTICFSFLTDRSLNIINDSVVLSVCFTGLAA